ncbi:DUF6455 family protein [Antarctobacter jejuensis]|uniref:DUF6455 family protein n=1 Tax=Antarctobacter jejuensis TaxID=1439938 RepID=UPI003FD51F6E
MHSQDALKRHASLVDRMAGVRGLDLEEEMLRGALSFTELEDSVLRCAQCTNPEGCAHWMAEQTAPAPESPSYCRNADLFRALEQR